MDLQCWRNGISQHKRCWARATTAVRSSTRNEPPRNLPRGPLDAQSTSTVTELEHQLSPQLARVYRNYTSQQVEFIGVRLDFDRDMQVSEGQCLTWPQVVSAGKVG